MSARRQTADALLERLRSSPRDISAAEERQLILDENARLATRIDDLIERDKRESAKLAAMALALGALLGLWALVPLVLILCVEAFRRRFDPYEFGSRKSRFDT